MNGGGGNQSGKTTKSMRVSIANGESIPQAQTTIPSAGIARPARKQSVEGASAKSVQRGGCHTREANIVGTSSALQVRTTMVEKRRAQNARLVRTTLKMEPRGKTSASRALPAQFWIGGVRAVLGIAKLVLLGLRRPLRA